jgi:hypothetical protein
MNEYLNVDLIGQQLNCSSANLDQPTLMRLRVARMQALARYDVRNTSRSFVWISALAGLGHDTKSQLNIYYWATALLCIALLCGGIGYWQNVTEHDSSDVDVAILTGDLPIEAYVE